MPSIPAIEARRLAATVPHTILLESTATAARLGRSFLFQNPVRWLEARTLTDVPGLLRDIDQALAQGLHAAGFLHYECGFAFEPKALTHPPLRTPQPLAAFGLYSDRHTVVDSHLSACDPRGLLALHFSDDEAAYAERFANVQAAIRAGDTYQLNLTLESSGFHDDPLALYEHMRRTQPVPFAALLHTGAHVILSASPELFFHLRGRDILTRPMKGTAPRSPTPSVDAAHRLALAHSEKDRAENVMIVDLLRNDLGRVAVTGSVRTDNLFHIEALPSVFQMTSDVRATLRDDVDTPALFASLFPSGSIIGAPKVRSMQLLRALEQRDRGIYTGAIGFFSPATPAAPAEAVFSVAIRTATLQNNTLHMGVGSGIVADSNAFSEYTESLLKASFLLDRDFQLIETMRWEHGRCALLDLHLARLAASARALGFTFDRTRAVADLQRSAAAAPPDSPCRLRLLLARDGSLQVSDPQPIAPASSLPLRVAIHPERTDAADPWLAHKSTRRARYDAATAQASAAGLADFLFVNTDGHLTEGAIHNVFLRHGNLWRTPPLTEGVLPGVFRRHLLATQPGMLEAHLTEADLVSADEILLTNALRGARPATVVTLDPSQSPRP